MATIRNQYRAYIGKLLSLANITENPRVGLLFMDFVRDRIGLHVNGSAEIVMPDRAHARYPGLPVDLVPGRKPQQWVVVEVHEAYIHCAKHIPRLAKLPRGRAWGTDDVRRKGGDFFGAAAEACPAAPPAQPAAVPAQSPEPAAVPAAV